jgi:hypothetical protein
LLQNLTSINQSQFFKYLFSLGTKHNNKTHVIRDNKARSPKRLTNVSFSYSPPQTPATKFPIKLVKNQQPIIKDKNLFGASLDTSDRPIGDKQSSAIVIIK